MSAARSISDPATQRTNRYGPSPTGARAKGAVASRAAGIVSSRWRGRMRMWYVASYSCSGYQRRNRKATVRLSRAVTEAMASRNGASGAFTTGLRYTPKVYATSAAVTGAPSCQRARGSRWNTIVSESGCSQLRASTGRKPESSTVLSAAVSSARRQNSRSETLMPVVASATGGSRKSASPVVAMIIVPSAARPAAGPFAQPATTSAAMSVRRVRTVRI